MGRLRGARDLGLDFVPCTEARINQSLLLEFGECAGVIAEVLRLAAHRLVPVESQPGQILNNGLVELGSASAEIYIFDTKHEFPGISLSRLPRHERRIGVAEMQKSRWTWRESSD